MPSVSVILPTFNRTGFLRLTVESVFSQTHSDWELVIADDGSGEETRSYLRTLTDPRVRILWLQHSGNPSKVRNAALAAAGGHYVAFLDSDDIWAAPKLQVQLAALRDHPECRWSYTACVRIDEAGRPLENARLRALVLRSGWIFEPLLKLEVAIAMPTVMARRDLIQEVGGFDELQLFGEYQDLCLRLALSSEAIAVDEPLCSVRAHREHYSSDRIAACASWMRLYEKMATIAPTAQVRALCAQLRAESALRLARMHGGNGNHREALATLCRSLRFSFAHPKWWLGALKELLRPVVPAVVLSALRSRRSSGSS